MAEEFLAKNNNDTKSMIPKIGSIKFLEQAKSLGFNSGFEYTSWLRKIGKIKSCKQVEDEWCRKKGFKNKKDYENNMAIINNFRDKKERNRSWHYDRGSISMSDNIDCAEYLGVYIAERKVARKILLDIFGNIEEMPYGNPGFDFICKENKIDVKSICIDSTYKLKFHVRWNRIATHFLFIGFENRENEKILGIWLIKGDEKARNSRSKNPGTWPKIRDRESLAITYKKEYLLPFKRYEITDKYVKDGILFNDV